MQVGTSSRMREAGVAIGESMKRVARRAAEVAESMNDYGNGNFKAHIDTTHKVVYETRAYTTIIELLKMLADGQTLPRKIVVDDIIYENVTRTGRNFLYYSDDTDHGLSLQLVLLRQGRPNDIDILNKEVGIIEW